MMLQQRLEDAEKEMDEHDRNLQRYKMMHEELSLEEIECVAFVFWPICR